MPFESTSEREHAQRVATSSTISIYDPPPIGANIRRAGEDIRVGRVVLARGIELRPAEIGVIASVGLAKVRVHRRPRVAILSTGNELLEPGEPLVPGKIYDSNTYSLAALVRRYGGVPVGLGIALDEVEDIRTRVRSGLETDLLLTSAGVSKGDYDVVKDVLAAEGAVEFWQVAIKPGRPMAFGLIQGVPHVGLPGNPVASIVAFEQFVRPAIAEDAGEKPAAQAGDQGYVPWSGHQWGQSPVFRPRQGGRGRGDRCTLIQPAPKGSGVLTSDGLRKWLGNRAGGDAGGRGRSEAEGPDAGLAGGRVGSPLPAQAFVLQKPYFVIAPVLPDIGRLTGRVFSAGMVAGSSEDLFCKNHSLLSVLSRQA